MRRAERRSRETVAIAKTTPAMTLKRLVRPEQVGDLMGRLNRTLNFDLGIDLGTASILILLRERAWCLMNQLISLEMIKRGIFLL